MTSNKSKAHLLENKNDKVIIGLIFLSILLILFSFFSPIVLTISAKKQQLNFKDTGGIGDTIGGLMNPFIALAGVFITFLAFYMQFKANKIQIELFNKNQNEQTDLLKEQLFFRLIDNLNLRIINFSYTEKTYFNGNSIEHQSYKALDDIIKQFKSKIEYKCIKHGKHLLASIPEKIDTDYYLEILKAKKYSNEPANLENAKKLKDSIIEQIDYNNRSEFIKHNIQSYTNDDEKLNNALKSIGREYFFITDFIEREGIYTSAYDEIYREFGGFMDGYTKNVSYLVDFITNNSANPFFLEYLKSNLSAQESILIFYYCSSSKSTKKFRQQINTNNLIEDIHHARDKFIDLPSEDTLVNELNFISNRS